jgi:hypothetical protein
MTDDNVIGIDGRLSEQDQQVLQKREKNTGKSSSASDLSCGPKRCPAGTGSRILVLRSRNTLRPSGTYRSNKWKTPQRTLMPD